MARREHNSEQTRARILDAAYSCLVDLGYAGTSTVAVCEAAGVARGTFLHHYRTRQDLLEALMVDVLRRRVESFEAEVAGHENVSIRFVLELIWREFSTPVFWAWLELVNASRTDDGLADRVRMTMLEFEASLTGLIVSVLDLHKLGSDVTPLKVATVLSGLVGVALDRLIKPDHDVELRAATMIDWGCANLNA